MRLLSALARSSLSMTLYACSQAAPAVMPAAAKSVDAAQSVGIRNPDAVLNLQCSNGTYALVGAGTERRLENRAGEATQVLRKPAGMEDYVPVGLGCATTVEGEPYLVVEYGEDPAGCKVCEWFFVYDSHGKPMNSSVPAIRERDGMPDPNNDDYERLIKQLELQHPAIQYAGPAG